EMLDGFTECVDVSFNGVRAISFLVESDPVYVLWSQAGESVVDASHLFGAGDVLMTPIVTQLDPSNAPVVTPSFAASANELPLSNTPVFIQPL
ncbi:hypothetical protein ACFLSZ_02970, partial [Candidatus Bipolaricaulota bacterium]